VDYTPDFDPVWERADLLLDGLAMTFLLALTAMAAAIVLGLLVAVAQMSSVRPLRGLATQYVQLARGTPLYVYIFWLYYSLGGATGILLTPFQAGVICLATLYAAYLAEIDRGALQAVQREQREAAKALGLSPLQSFRDVVLPQAVRTVIPPTTNVFAMLVMDTSLVSAIGATELIRLARVGSSETFRPFEFYTVMGMIYVAVVLAISGLSAWLERRLRYEHETPPPRLRTAVLQRVLRRPFAPPPVAGERLRG
jgi:polar amino acid transport system permease protein